MKSMSKFLTLMLAVIVCAPAYAVETWPVSDNGTSRFISGPNLKVKVWPLKPISRTSRIINMCDDFLKLRAVNSRNAFFKLLDAHRVYLADHDINHEASFVMIKDGAGTMLARFKADEISK